MGWEQIVSRPAPTTGHFHAALLYNVLAGHLEGFVQIFVMVMTIIVDGKKSGEDISDNDGLYGDSRNLLRSYK